MRRRTAIAVIAGLLAPAAGCAEVRDRVVPGGPTQRDPLSEEAPSGAVDGAAGYPSDICEATPNPTSIPAVLEPAFAPDWTDIDTPLTLTPEKPVVGVARAGRARAYPISLLGRHEVVNDAFDVPILVTFCPACSSGLTAVRAVDGEPSLFGNTGLLWTPPNPHGQAAIDDGVVFGFGYRSDTVPRDRLNLVMFDHRTGSFWSQILARAICGPRAGTPLRLVPSTVATWGEWRREHPETEVLLPAPYSTTAAARR